MSHYNCTSHSERGFKDTTGEQMRVTPWCLLPLHHSKDLTVSTVVRARDRRKCAMAVAYRSSFVVGYGNVQLQLQGVRGGGRRSLIATTLSHTDFTKRLVWIACRNTFCVLTDHAWSYTNHVCILCLYMRTSQFLQAEYQLGIVCMVAQSFRLFLCFWPTTYISNS